MRGNLSAIKAFALFMAASALLAAPCARSARCATTFPPLPRGADLGAVRQPFFRNFSPWAVDHLLFPVSAARAAAKAETEAPREAADPYRRAEKRSFEARKAGDSPRAWEDAARLYMQAYAAAKNRPLGEISLRRAARAFFFGENYREADGVLTKVVARLGNGPERLAFLILKGETLARRGNHLSARECFRRAAGGTWDAETSRRIALRIADLSLLSGNAAFADTAYRKIFASPALYKTYPYEAVRYGDALILGGKPAKAAEVYRGLQGEGMPPEVRAAAFLGEGDARLLSGDREGARYAYQQAEIGRTLPALRGWIDLRRVDLALSGGEYAAAAEKYAELRTAPDAGVAREAGHKRLLALYLAGDFERVVRESTAYLEKNPAASDGGSAVRKMAARAGAELVRRAGAGDPSSRWASFSTLLFSFGGTDEGKALYVDIGREWESAGIWGGASELYASGGSDARSVEMARVERAERLYVRGDLVGALQALDVGHPARAPSNGALWLASKILLRQGRYDDAARTVRRIAPPPAEARTQSSSPPPPETELLAFALGLQDKWDESRGVLRGFDRPSQPPPLQLLSGLAESHAGGGYGPARTARPGARGGSGGDPLAAIGTVQARYIRAMTPRDGLTSAGGRDDAQGGADVGERQGSRSRRAGADGARDAEGP